MDGDILEGMRRRRGVNRLEKHGPSMLVEEFRCVVDMIICAGVGPSYNHHSDPRSAGRRWVIDAVIVDGRLQKMRMLLQPVHPISTCYELKGSYMPAYHFGRFNGKAMLRRISKLLQCRRRFNTEYWNMDESICVVCPEYCCY